MSSDLSPHALAPGTQIRDYTIVSVIGTGGFSIVYKAIDNSLQREVAIKEYFPTAMALRAGDGTIAPHSRDTATFSKGIESFLNEGKLLAAFDHPALVRVYRCWEERGTAYLAMRLYAGTTLRDAVTAGDWRTDEASLHALLAPLCDALDVLHASKVYHRDVAPDNIMLVDAGVHPGSRWVPVLLDFGAARKTIESTQVFTAILKPGYAPIEQYGDGELKQGPWTDIYALAGLVYFTLAGSAPPTAISRMIRDGMQRPRDAFVGRLPEHWLDAIERALAVKPELRPQSMDEFVELFDWGSMTEGMTTVVLPPVHSLPPPIVQLAQPVLNVAQESAVTKLVDDRTVVVPLPPKLAPAAVKVAASPPDDDSTVIVPRRAVDAQIVAKKLEPKPAPVAQVTPKIAPMPRSDAAPAKSRSLLWIAAIAVFIAVAALAWKLTSRPAVSPVVNPPATDTRLTEPQIKPANDTSSDKKTSLPREAPPKPKPVPVIVAPDPVANPLVPAPVTTPPAAQKTAVTESPSSTEFAVKAKDAKDAKAAAKASAKEKAKAARAAASNTGESDGEDSPPARTSRRPERCNALMERFQLGESLSDADQRFMRESCR